MSEVGGLSTPDPVKIKINPSIESIKKRRPRRIRGVVSVRIFFMMISVCDAQENQLLRL